MTISVLDRVDGAAELDTLSLGDLHDAAGRGTEVEERDCRAG